MSDFNGNNEEGFPPDLIDLTAAMTAGERQLPQWGYTEGRKVPNGTFDQIGEFFRDRSLEEGDGDIDCDCVSDAVHCRVSGCALTFSGRKFGIITDECLEAGGMRVLEVDEMDDVLDEDKKSEI